jgi:phenylpropionate dioxygenase-like ring-hydroxylating dioxygenase large terminal subunit
MTEAQTQRTRESANAPFLRNAWYVGAWSEELANGPFARTIMNEPIAFFRDASGKVNAIEDRCCHRGAALTDGKVVENGLQCGYHGLVFDGTGACVEIPGQDTVPPMARVKGYPVVERQEFVWIWMGDPALADEGKIIDWPFHDDANQHPHRKAVLHIKANYLMMIDNLMDLTHLGYVHSKTIGGNPLSHVNAKMDVVRTEQGVKLTRWMLNALPPPTYLKGVPFEGRVDRWQEFEYVLPCSVLQWSGALDVGKGAQQNRDQHGVHLRLYHAITPETETSSHYLFSVGASFGQHDPAIMDAVFYDTYPTFIEDVEIMNNQQARIDLDPYRPLLNIKADNAVVQARRAFRAAYEAEQQQGRVAAE